MRNEMYRTKQNMNKKTMDNSVPKTPKKMQLGIIEYLTPSIVQPQPISAKDTLHQTGHVFNFIIGNREEKTRQRSMSRGEGIKMKTLGNSPKQSPDKRSHPVNPTAQKILGLTFKRSGQQQGNKTERKLKALQSKNSEHLASTMTDLKRQYEALVDKERCEGLVNLNILLNDQLAEQLVETARKRQARTVKDTIKHETEYKIYSTLKLKSSMWNRLRSKTHYSSAHRDRKEQEYAHVLPVHAQEEKVNHRKFHSLPVRHPLQTAYETLYNLKVQSRGYEPKHESRNRPRKKTAEGSRESLGNDLQKGDEVFYKKSAQFRPSIKQKPSPRKGVIGNLDELTPWSQD